MCLLATLMHAFLYFRKQIWVQSRRSLREQPDIHARLMSKYPQGMADFAEQRVGFDVLTQSRSGGIFASSWVCLPWASLALKCGLRKSTETLLHVFNRGVLNPHLVRCLSGRSSLPSPSVRRPFASARREK